MRQPLLETAEVLKDSSCIHGSQESPGNIHLIINSYTYTLAVRNVNQECWVPFKISDVLNKISYWYWHVIILIWNVVFSSSYYWNCFALQLPRLKQALSRRYSFSFLNSLTWILNLVALKFIFVPAGVSLHIEKHVVDRMLFNDRCLEEEEILFHEMANFLSFYKDVLLPSLENRKEQYLADLEDTFQQCKCNAL